jgi:hypothetical protein
MNAVEAYIQFKPGLFTDTGEVIDENVAQFLRDHMDEFRNFIVRVLTVLPRRDGGRPRAPATPRRDCVAAMTAARLLRVGSPHRGCQSVSPCSS